MLVFDRAAVRRHRARAAAHLAAHDYLIREVAERLIDRLDDVRRQFPRALAIGCYGDLLPRLLAGRSGIATLVSCDLALERVRQAPGLAVAADEEALPFACGSLDLVVALLTLHWVNDLPGALAQIRRALKPDGLLLAAMFGGQTLHQLRTALTEAEVAVENGLSPRVSPFADVRDAGGLLQRAGFALPVVDSDSITVSYADALTLWRDLRGMGESNAVIERRKSFSRRQTLLQAAARYRDRFADAEGRLPVTFQVLYLTAWAPDASQPQPLRPGSGRMRLADALRGCEIPGGDVARPTAEATDGAEGGAAPGRAESGDERCR
jgi:SAM-dependent methyltransferase